MRAKDYQAILQTASEIMGEGMHIVDSSGKSIVYNEEMAKLEKISVKDVLGKPFREAFSFIPESQSTLYRALKLNEATINKEQTYLNVYGKQVTTINSTMPIEVDGKVVAAIEVAKDITNIKNMSDTILELQESSMAHDEYDESKVDINGNPKIKKYTFDSLVGNSPQFREVVSLAGRASKTDATVLISGETGTGKELFAQSIHYGGARKNKPFLAQNCAALPESLLEGILFGTAKGGFTGAVDRAGLFEQASGGTLLLDENAPGAGTALAARVRPVVSEITDEQDGAHIRGLLEATALYLPSGSERLSGARGELPFDIKLGRPLGDDADVRIDASDA